ncbi:hypothetical protein KSP39_PZI023865 [Platanthera zijinensis]|uniref:Uncharacterized protein n=1 Tax=Platanthera zijinensis TaxID=2320716 RepID=A0AAP0ASU8_9ASPA
MKTFPPVILVVLLLSAISTEAREIKLAKPDDDYKQPQTFPGYEGLLPNPGLGGIGTGIPGGGFGLPSISAPPVLGGGSSLPSFGGLPGFPGAGFGGQPRVPGQP